MVEATEKELVYIKVDLSNEKQIEEVLFQEKEGFGSGLDPQELPSVLRFIATNGTIWLQYVLEDGKKNPTGVIGFIPLEKALGYNDLYRLSSVDLSHSPLIIIMENQARVFVDARRFAKDKDIVYHHSLATSRRGKGYGTLLLRHALNKTPHINNKIIIGLIDAANLNKENGKLQLVPNENSFTIHLKAGFVLAGVVDAPVCDETITFYSFVRPRNKIVWANVGRGKEFFMNLAEGRAKKVLDDVKKYTEMGYLGISYNKETHQMHFVLSKN
ncbi:MAG: GNAT family N-acetyltransferase [Candidatus Nealsonbacteria bacterium]